MQCQKALCDRIVMENGEVKRIEVTKSMRKSYKRSFIVSGLRYHEKLPRMLNELDPRMSTFKKELRKWVKNNVGENDPILDGKEKEGDKDTKY